MEALVGATVEGWAAEKSNNESNEDDATGSGAVAKSRPESESNSMEGTDSKSEAEAKAEVAAMIAGRKSTWELPHLFAIVLTPAEMPMPKRRQKASLSAIARSCECRDDFAGGIEDLLATT